MSNYIHPYGNDPFLQPQQFHSDETQIDDDTIGSTKLKQKQQNPIASLPDTAVRSLYLSRLEDPLYGLTQIDEHNVLKSILYWRSPLTTLITLLCINLLSILITFYNFYFITLLCYILLAQILISFVYIHLTKFYLNFLGSSPTIQELTQYDGPYYDKDDIRVTVEFLCKYIYLFLDQCIIIYRCLNHTKTVTTMFILFFCAQLARLVPIPLLTAWFINFLAIILLFRHNLTLKLKWQSFLLSLFSLDTFHPDAFASLPSHNYDSDSDHDNDQSSQRSLSNQSSPTSSPTSSSPPSPTFQRKQRQQQQQQQHHNTMKKQPQFFPPIPASLMNQPLYTQAVASAPQATSLSNRQQRQLEAEMYDKSTPEEEITPIDTTTTTTNTTTNTTTKLSTSPRTLIPPLTTTTTTTTTKQIDSSNVKMLLE